MISRVPFGYWDKNEKILRRLAAECGSYAEASAAFAQAGGLPVSVDAITNAMRRRGIKLSRDSEEVSTVEPDERQQQEIGALRDQLAGAEHALRQLRREREGRQRWIDQVRDSVCNSCAALEPPPKIKVRKKSVSGKSEVAVLLLSDAHFGKLTLEEDVLGENAYSLSIAEHRISTLAEAVETCLEIEQKGRRISTLRIFLAGDMVTGTNIYKGQSFHIEGNALRQAISGTNAIAGLCQYLSRKWSIEIDAVPGNHGRSAPVGIAHPGDSWDLVMYYFLEHRLSSNDRITMRINNTQSPFVRVDVSERKFLLGHGNATSARSLMDTAVRKMATEWPAKVKGRVDGICVGHWHVPDYRNWGGVDIFVNGSLCGADTFAMSKLPTVAPPRQWLFGVSPERVTWQRLLDPSAGETYGERRS